MHEAMVLPFAFVRRWSVVYDPGEHASSSPCVLCQGEVPADVVWEVGRRVGWEHPWHRVDADVFERVLERVYHAQTAQDWAAQMPELVDWSGLQEALPESRDLLDQTDDTPIIRLMNALFTQAIQAKASDIHMEPCEDKLVIRFRIDGVLQTVLHANRVLAPLLISRIKVMAKLDIAEHRLPQDGRMALKWAGRAVDVRVSTLPCRHGERVVLRVLDRRVGALGLHQLGMDEDTQRHVRAVLQAPHGLVLVTGPTGSGKTTTLYAALELLNDASRNILTVEDPIEYDIEGIGQMQVNAKVDLTFAKGLRSMLRQDPDVVMVGEIRDMPTAQVAMRASLTGHLVLSTLHTNTAVGAVVRLHDMGVARYLLAAGVRGVLAQRLVRLLCPACKRETACDPSLGIDHHVFEAVGCAACHHTGFVGRTGLYEWLSMDETLRQLVQEGAPSARLEAHARTQTRSMWEQGVAQVASGAVSVSELWRVLPQEPGW